MDRVYIVHFPEKSEWVAIGYGGCLGVGDTLESAERQAGIDSDEWELHGFRNTMREYRRVVEIANPPF